jgi:hypothetical protein
VSAASSAPEAFGAVRVGGCQCPGASMFVFGTVALIVLILVAVYRPRKRR